MQACINELEYKVKIVEKKRSFKFAEINYRTYLEVVRLDENAVCRKKIAILNLANIADDDFTDPDLFHFTLSNNRELVFPLDSALKPPKLPLLGVIIKRSDEHHHDDRNQNCQTFNPTMTSLIVIQG